MCIKLISKRFVARYEIAFGAVEPVRSDLVACELQPIEGRGPMSLGQDAFGGLDHAGGQRDGFIDAALLKVDCGQCLARHEHFRVFRSQDLPLHLRMTFTTSLVAPPGKIGTEEGF